MWLLAAFAVSLVTPADQSELVFLRQRVAELEAKAVAFKSGGALAHGAEQHARSLALLGGGGSLMHGQGSEEPAVLEEVDGAPPADEPPPAAPAHHASHTIFKMPDEFDRSFMMWMLVVLVIVTIGFEKGSEALEEAVGEHCIERELLDKMFKELTILGFVAFSATMLIQAEMLPLTHGQHLCFEFAHVLMFTTAIFYAKEIFLVAGMLKGIKLKFEDYDDTPNQAVLDKQLNRYGNRTDEVPAILYQPVPFKLAMSRHYEHLMSVFSRHEQVVVFKSLKFHFLGFNGLLGTRFDIADYIHNCSKHHVGEMIEIGLEAWSTLLAILCIGLAGTWFEAQATDEAPLVHVGTLLFILWGFLLMLGEVVLLMVTKDNLSQMTEKNHHIRTEMEGDRWEEYDERRIKP